MSGIRGAATDPARGLDLTGGVRSSGGEAAVEAILDGEIYNRERLWRLLGAEGAAGGGSDADLIVGLYGEFGEDFVSALDGAFAFVLRDAPERVLFLGRDGFGRRPISYATAADGGLVVAAEGDPPAGDEGEEVCPVLPGHLVSWRPGEEPRVHRYWSPPAPTDSNAESDGDLVADLRAILTASVRVRLPSEGSVGVATDGGLGASVLAEIAAAAGASVKTFSATEPAGVDVVLDATGAEAFGGAAAAAGIERPAAAAPSTEVRSPYLSMELVEFAATVPQRLLDGGLLRALLEQRTLDRVRGRAPGA